MWSKALKSQAMFVALSAQVGDSGRGTNGKRERAIDKMVPAASGTTTPEE